MSHVRESSSRDQPGLALLYNEFAMEVQRQQALGLALIALLIMLLVLLRRLWSGA